MRPIDADALKDNMFHYAAPEMMWDRGDIEHKINEMPTIDAIPVEWLKKQCDSYDYNLFYSIPLKQVLKSWKIKKQLQNERRGSE